MHMYREFGADFLHHLDGIFSFVLFDVTNNLFVVARDAIGVTTLYYGFNSSSPSTFYVASEMKCLNDICDTIISFPPGHIFDSVNGFRQWYQPIWFNQKWFPKEAADYGLIRKKLVKAVKKRLMSEVPYGVMLSGGLDSNWKSSENSDSSGSSGDEQMDNYWPRLHSFSIGLPDKLIRIDSFFEFQILNSFFTLRSPDLICAKEVADFLQTVHHEYHFTVQEGLDAISDVIHHLETYDVTTVRASTPMYLLSRKIKANSVKMVLSGEGSDEIFGGYLYFHSAPDKYSFHQETVERVRNLHTSDCLRANKSTMAWGLEARVPFLDKDFLDVIMSIDPSEKMCSANRIEKYILRKAFDTSNEPNKEPYLPEKILWRQKEQFSDGVGYSWIDSLKIEAEHRIPDDLFSNRTERWPEDTPQTKEAYWYREIFEMHFPQKACVKSVVRWIPRSDWGCPTDPSGRAQKIHQKSLYSQRERNFNEIQIA
ncbi:Asparagine synthetase [glutamine-hydrolyzing] 2 [Sarcoptes scabiei]|uniref:Asparagine synthetase [glutamine-hydrolyzing] n=2 Tax=Sarcoptes scabiei TaxID=52283 RepID=A0A834RB68_SARSC|nr:Asparagine synthetase [glutamine-hydrolyzing] 2 [Sarcoptes scabiei]